MLLPDENVIGQPFWTIMIVKEGNLTGNYYSYNNGLLLFFSKKIALEVSLITGGVVRGLNQKHLKILVNIAELYKLKLFINIFDNKNIQRIYHIMILEIYL